MEKRLPKLDERLAAIASMVRDGGRCADIGTDHGYLIAWLAASGRISQGYACDINQKPLDKAAFSLSAYDATERVTLLLCDGLSGLQAGAVDDIIIAGMGGELIWEIIDAQPWTRDPALRFLLQPMTKPDRLRRSLYRGGFAVVRERAVVSGGFPYSIMETIYTGEQKEITLEFAYTGLLLEQTDHGARQYVAKAARLIREKAQGLARASAGKENPADYEALLDRLERR